jgi:hypothetical protein
VIADSDVIVNEISVQMKPPDRSAILMIEGSGSSVGGHNSHYLVQVTKQLPFKQWIFDITGPQLNVFDPCLDLPTYSAKYIDRFQLTAPLGTARILFDDLADTKGIPGAHTRIDRDAVRALETCIQEWQSQSRNSLPELLRQPEGTFKRQQKELLTAVQRSLDQFALFADYTSELSSCQQDAKADFSSMARSTIAVFNKHEEYLRQFKD